MFSVVTRVRGEVRAGALPSEDRNPAGGPLVDPPSRVFAFHGVHAMSVLTHTLRTLLSLSGKEIRLENSGGATLLPTRWCRRGASRAGGGDLPTRFSCSLRPPRMAFALHLAAAADLERTALRTVSSRVVAPRAELARAGKATAWVAKAG